MIETKQKTGKDERIVQPVRTYKDRVFRMIFKDKWKLLELYNAINETNYQDPEELIITTLENAIYLGMKNDVSFLLQDQLSLYEHQSTDNPNMPLRNLFYISDVYSGITKNSDLYGTQMVRIPEPQFVVFYNGTEKRPEKWEQKLSDAYSYEGENPSLELKTTVLNINLGQNEELAKKCRPLWEYMMFVEKIRQHRKVYSLAQAVELAVEECIREDILADFLKQNRAEVVKMSIYEYDEERHIRNVYDLGAKSQLIKMICRKLERGKSIDSIAEGLDEDKEFIEKIAASALELIKEYSWAEVCEKIIAQHCS